MKIILMILLLACSNNIYNLKFLNKGINEDFIKAIRAKNIYKIKALIINGANVNYIDENEYYSYTPLMYSSRLGDIEVVKLLLENGAEINSVDIRGRTASIIASESGNMEILKLLVQRGANINDRNNCGWRILDLPSTKGNVEIVKLLLDKGANINTPILYDKKRYYQDLEISLERGGNLNFRPIASILIDIARNGHLEIIKIFSERGVNFNDINEYGVTPLIGACEGGHLEIVELLIKNGVDTNAKTFDKIIFGKSFIKGGSALLWASRAGNLNIVRSLLENDAYLDFKDNLGENALVKAALGGHTEVIKLLISKNAEVDTEAERGLTPLMAACKSGIIEIFNLIVVKTSNIMQRSINGRTLLMFACEGANIDIVKKLLEKNVDVNEKDNLGNIALNFALKNRCEDIAKLLINKGADINHKSQDGFMDLIDFRGDTILMHACESGLLNIVKMLLDMRVINSFKDSKGIRELVSACIGGNVEVVKLLIDKIEKEEKKDINHLSSYWRNSPYEINLLILASFYGYKDIIKLLIEKGVNINYKDRHGDVALIEASKKGCFKGAKILLKNGAEVDLEDKYGYTAFMKTLTSNSYSFYPRFRKVAELLIRYGADINHTNSKGETALTIIQSRNKEAVKFLLERGATINKNISVLKDLFNLVITEKNSEDQRELLNLVLFNKKSLNVEFLLLMYKQSLNYKTILKPFFMENLIEGTNICNIFMLDAFTFKQRTLLVDIFLNLIETYDLTRMDEIKSIKIELIELFLEYYEGKLSCLKGYEDKFIYEYRNNRNNVKSKISEFVSKMYEAMKEFNNEFTNEDLISGINGNK